MAAPIRKFDPFEDGPVSIEERFAEQGRRRQDLVWRTYVTQEGVGAPLYDLAGRRWFCGVRWSV